MATRSENIEYEQQEWDMEFKDPFSLEENELPVTIYCSGSVSQSAVLRTSFLSQGHSAVETSNSDLVQTASTVVTTLLQTVSRDNKTRTTGVESPNWKQNSQHHQSEMEANTHSSTPVSADRSNRTQHVNGPVTSCGKKMSDDTNVEFNSSEVKLTSSEEQLPIPVMLSSAKRFCADDDIENSQAAKHDNAYFRLPPTPAILNESPVRFAPPVYPPTAYSIPAWRTVLPVNNSGTGAQVRSVLPYSVPYSSVLPHSSNVSALYNQSHTPVVEVTGAPHWPRARLHLQNIITTPPPSLPGVRCATALGLPASDFAVFETLPVRHMQNGLTSHRLPLATVHQVIPPFPPPNINRMLLSSSPHSVLLPCQGQPHNAVKSNLPVVSNVPVNTSTGQVPPRRYSVGAQQTEPSSTSANVSACSSSSAVVKCNNTSNNTECNSKHCMPNDRTLLSTAQLRPTLPVTCTSSSAESVSKQTVTAATAASHSNIPPPQVKFSSTFAQLDPRIHSGQRQSCSAAAQSQSSAIAASTPSSTFVVPVPPPLPSLEELTADSSVHPHKDDKAAIVGSNSQSTASGTTTTDSAKLDAVVSTSNCLLSCKTAVCV